MHILRSTIKVLLLTFSLSLFLRISALAQEYSCGAYGAGEFGEGACEVATSGDVANTGINVWLIRALALLLIALATFIVWRVAKKRKN